MTYEILSITDAARGLKYYTVKISDTYDKKLKMPNNSTQAEIDAVVDDELEKERIEDERKATMDKAIEEAYAPLEVRNGTSE